MRSSGSGKHRDVAQRRRHFLGERGVGALTAGLLELRPPEGFAVGVGAGPVDGTRGDRHGARLGDPRRARRTDRHLQQHGVVDARELADRAQDLSVAQEDTEPGLRVRRWPGAAATRPC